jgi:hypothetical protein
MIDKQFIAGQPNRKASKDKDAELKFYALGRASAGLEGKRQEIERDTQMSIMQKLLLQNAKDELKGLTADLAVKQVELDAKMQQLMAPPPLPMGPPGMYPPEMGGPPGMPPPGMGMPPPMPPQGDGMGGPPPLPPMYG